MKTAIALAYPKEAPAPVILAKEKGELAQKLVELARKESVPVVEDETLASVLTAGEIGQCIPLEAFSAVAAVFAFVQQASEAIE